MRYEILLRGSRWWRLLRRERRVDAPSRNRGKCARVVDGEWLRRRPAFATPLSGSELLLWPLVGVVCDVGPPLLFLFPLVENQAKRIAPRLLCLFVGLAPPSARPFVVVEMANVWCYGHLTTASCYSEIQDGDSSSLQ